MFFKVTPNASTIKNEETDSHLESNDNENKLTSLDNLNTKRQDFFIWQSAVDNYKAMRDRNDGSIFIKCLVTAIVNSAYKYDLFRIFVETNNLMKLLGGAGLSTLHSTGTKVFYFKIGFQRVY